MNTATQTKARKLPFLVALAVTVATSMTVAQSWEDGMYRNGMHQMNWGGQLPIVTLTGKAIDDTTFVRSVGGVSMGRAYYIDTVGNGSKSYQLFFGPYWYQPGNGANRPKNGESVTIKGGKMSQFIPAMIDVYEINGKKWRDSTGAPGWSGRWIHRSISDTTRVYCPTDSASHVGFTRGFMGMGMMGGGMMWPDSLFCQFEQLHPDSLPGMQRGRSVMGFHLDISNPQGAMMMQEGMQGHGWMGFQTGIRMRFRAHPDSLKNRGLSMNQLTLLYLDTDNQWTAAPNQIVDLQTSTVSIASSNAYSYYALATSSVTSVESQTELIPTELSLEQNYPNPFNPSTTITFSIPQRGFVTLKVYNSLGEEVASLVSRQLDRGTYKARWNAANVASGLYMYRIQVGELLAVKKMLVVR